MSKTLLVILGLACAVISAAGIMWYNSPNNPASIARRQIYALQFVIEKNDISLAKKAISELVLKNDEKSCAALIGALNPQPDTEVYWLIMEGISRVTDKKALETITDFIIANKDKAFSPDLLWMMRNNKTMDVLPLLDAALKQGSQQMQVASLRQISAIPCKKSLEILIGFLETLDEKEKKDRGLIKETINSLKMTAGVHKGNYTAPWIQWWEENKNKDVSDIIRPKPRTPKNWYD